MIIELQEPDMDKLRAEWLSRVACDHSKIEHRIRTLSNDSTQVCKQCLNCGATIGQAVSKKDFSPKEMERMAPFDTEREKRFAKEKDDLWYQMVQDERARLREDWRTRYEAYRQTEAWKTRRKLVLKRADNTCEGCLTAKATEIHHTTYSHCGEELLFQLLALCEECHQKCHPAEAPPLQQADSGFHA